MPRRQLAIVFVALLGVAGIGYIVVPQMWVAHWTTETSSQIKQIHQSALTAANIEMRPRSPYALIWDDYFASDLIFVHGSSRSPVDVLVGDTNLANLLAMPWAQARSIVFGLPQSESEWDLLGDFLLGFSTMTTATPDLVVGISTECPYRAGLRVVLYGDNSCVVVSGTEWIETQNARRAALALERIPSLP